MIEIILGLSVVISFFLTVSTMPYWIRKAKGAGLVWEDMNKSGNPKNVAGSGGVVAVLAFIIGILYYVAMRTFLSRASEVSLEIFALISVILIFTLVGIIDDLLGWHNKGLSIRSRILLAIIASTPLIVINAGISSTNIPFFGSLEFGLLYPLLFIPLGVAGAATTYNFLAGFNGLEAGQGAIILTFLSYVSFITGTFWLAVIGMTMVFALLGFLIFNRNPAKVFPGDSLTWAVGALIAGMAILGNFEKIAVFIFIPYILEVGLKLRGRLEKQSFGKPNKDGSLDLKYEKVYGLTHLSIYLLNKMGVKPTENKVVYSIHVFQILIIILAWIIFL